MRSLAFAVHAAIWALGLPLVDNALLEPLATACAREARWEFLLCIAPLPIPRLSMTRSAGILFRSSAGITPAKRAFIEAIKRRARDLGDN